jgi:transcriptional regulator with XRE-family HTH domain
MTTASPGPEERVPGTEAGSIPGDTFSARLVLVRHFAGRLSIEQAARRCGLNAGNWAHWEDGRRPRDQVQVAQAIAEALDINLSWLIFGGALAGARGMPTKRTAEDNRRLPHVHPQPAEGNDPYLPVPVRPKDTRPGGRPAATSTRATTGPSPRRPVRITRPVAA